MQYMLAKIKGLGISYCLQQHGLGQLTTEPIRITDLTEDTIDLVMTDIASREIKVLRNRS